MSKIWIRPGNAGPGVEPWHLTTEDLKRDGWVEITQPPSGFDIINEVQDEVQSFPLVDTSYTVDFTVTDSVGWRKLHAMLTLYDPTVHARTPQHMPTLRHVAPHR